MNALEGRVTALEPVPPLENCSAIKTTSPESPSGVYTIDPDGLGAFDVYCDMTTDGGGWTVFQRRKDGTVNFHRSYAEYAAGFGSLTGEFWLGNDKIARLTRTAGSLRIDMKTGAAAGNKTAAVTYSTFNVGDYATSYKLTATGFQEAGPNVAGDSLSYQNGQPFTAYDADNDSWTGGNCAATWKGGWWFAACYSSNLNGLYYPGGSHGSTLGTGIDWTTMLGNYEGMVFTEMKTREPAPPPAYDDTDCGTIKATAPASTSGVYTINPDDLGAFDVYCDMTTDGGGWTVFQRRQDGSVDFYRSFAQYAAGFGSLTGEFWLGNDKIARLTKTGAPKLRIDLKAADNQAASATYTDFKVGDASTGYMLTADGFIDGGAGDSLWIHSGRAFSTFDVDNDLFGGSCAVNYHGAWWYANCNLSNLNGLYSAGGSHAGFGNGVDWYTFRGFYEGMVFTEMKSRK